MKNFSEDTKDCIEQLYQTKILKNFPAYAEFWEKFIGVKTSIQRGHSSLRPYGLIIPSSLRSEAKNIRKIYGEISYTHYSLFCHLAGAHFQLGKLRQSLKAKISAKRHFKHWEHFEVFYLHLGITMNQIYHLWGLVFLLKGRLTRNIEGEIKGAKRVLEELLVNRRKKYLWGRIDKIYKEIIILRNSITHFARVPSTSLPDGSYTIPRRVVKDIISWDKRVKSGIKTTSKARKDLNNIEQLFNELHRVMLGELDNCLARKRIKINYKE